MGGFSMKSIRFNLSTLLRPLRVLIALCVFAFLVLSQAGPAYSQTSSPEEGEKSLPGVEREAQELIKPEQGPPSREETQRGAQQDTNVIQGGADAEKQQKPKGSERETVEERLKESLED